MEPNEALLQLFGMLSVLALLIALVEGCLWWWISRYSHKAFWPVCVFASASVGAAVLFFGSSDLAVWLAGLGMGLSLFFRVVVRGRGKLAFMMLTPAFLLIALVIVYPFFFQLRLAFSNLNLYSIAGWLRGGDLNWVGLKNFAAVLNTDFWILLGRTLLWTLINVVFHVAFGLGIAMLLNRDVKFKGLYRTILIVPWAMPQVVAILAWRGEFHPEFGIINHLIQTMGFEAVQWWSSPIPIFISCCIVNIWLGIPFMLIVFLGGLGSIPKSYYEAAAIDGASKWTQFWAITLPLLKPVVIPSVTLGTIWTFNNINVIYLMTGQDGGTESADILVSALYKSAFTYSRYSYSAAFSMVILIVLLGITMGWLKISKASVEVR